jgi:hypothetical protein
LVAGRSATDQIGEEDNSDDEDTTAMKGAARQRKTIVKKPIEDNCYDQICVLLAMMFDNIQYHWQQLNEKKIVSDFQRISLNRQEGSISSNDGAEDVEDVVEDRISNKKSQPQRKALRERNMNIIVGKELTAKNLALFNAGLA